MQNFNDLPEDVVLEILSLVPSTDLTRSCRRVCSMWKDLTDSPTLWKTKCQRMGYLPKDYERYPSDWKIYYRLCSLKKNLLKNPCALEKFKHWKIEENGGDRWKIEDLPGEHGQNIHDEKVKKYFVTSYGSCMKSQIIDLKKNGYQDKLMDIVQPEIVIKDWFAPRHDCGSMYIVLVRLLSKKKETIQEFCPGPVYMEQWSNAEWKEMTHTFRDYGEGVRYIYFQHGGKDTQFWAGWYGVRVTNSSVTIQPENLLA
ncbi:F-box only protein 6-like [Pelobates fuscus]|uniref:F-box only protein 6-like n=1 Tax=Pelobates fuscus TaxID=191477 RepID=UPI002FE4548D